MLEIKKITCGYDNKFFLKEISFNLLDKEIVGIIGPNGSGKTTLLRAITKIIKLHKGDIFFRGKNIDEMCFKELAGNIAVVSQFVEPVSNITVEEYVLLGRIPYRKPFQFFESKSDEKIVKEAMELTDTLRFKDRFVHQLSGGERQLVSIARAIAQQPKLWLLDEPISHLDISHQVRILDLIKKLNKQTELSVLIVLHDLNLAGEYCDRLVLMNNGCIHKIGVPENVLEYKTIEDVYKTVVVVEKNPISSKPYVFIVSKEAMAARKK